MLAGSPGFCLLFLSASCVDAGVSGGVCGLSIGVEGPSFGVPGEPEVDEPAQFDGCCTGGAARPCRAVAAFRSEAGLVAGVDRHRDLVGAGDGVLLVLDRQIVPRLLVITEFGGTCQRPRFDQSCVFGFLEVGADRSGPICRIRQHGETRILAVEQVDTDRSVWGIR